MQSSTVTRAMRRCSCNGTHEKVARYLAVSDPNCKVARASHFPWRPATPLLRRAGEAPCEPYPYTFAWVVTASVHPQLSGTRSLSPDTGELGTPCRGGRLPSRSWYRSFNDLNESYHGTQSRKNRPVH